MERFFPYHLRAILKILLSSILIILPSFYFSKTYAKPASEPSEIAVSTFESGNENWNGTGSLETDHVKQGKTSLKLTSDGFNWNAYSAANVNLDLSLFTKSNYEMAIFVYVEDPSKISGIRLDLGTDSMSFFFDNQQTSSFYQQGWNEIRFKGEEFLVQNPPVDWSQIKYIRINLAANDSSSTVSAWFDDWKITNVSKVAISPNVKGEATSFANRNFEKQLIIGSHMFNNVIWSIIILVLIGLGIWLIVKYLKKRKTTQTESQPEDKKSRVSFSFFSKNINPKILIILGVLLVVLTSIFIWYYLTSKSPSMGVGSGI